MRFVSFAMLAVAALTVTACGDSKTTVASTHIADGKVVNAGSVEITSAAFRAPLGNNANTAAYAVLKNTGGTDDRLVSASCDCADKVEIHTMTQDNGMMVMQPLPDGLVIKAGDSVRLAPGGNHIMLLGLKSRPAPGQQQPLTLTFEKAGTVVVNFPVVEQVTASGATSASAHGGH